MLMAVVCVRNTVIEDYHTAGKLTDPEMMAFNKEVTNRIYTVLQMLYNPRYEAGRKEYLANLLHFYPHEWDLPKIDPKLKGPFRKRFRKGEAFLTS